MFQKRGKVKKMFHDHTYHLENKQEESSYIIFNFRCNKCGKPKTRIVSSGSEFDIEI